MSGIATYHPEFKGDTAPIVNVLTSNLKKQSIFLRGITSPSAKIKQTLIRREG